MKNIIIGLVIGLTINGIVVFAKENIIVNPIQTLTYFHEYNGLGTTKITAPEGTYRIFTVANNGTGVGITAVKIK